MKIYIRNRQRLLKVSQQEIERLLRKALSLLRLNRAELSVLFVNDRAMRVLNREYRGIDRTTDVLSFPQQGDTASPCETSSVTMKPENTGDPVPGDILGDIVINLHQTKRQAAEYGVTFHTELKKLLVHGLLHLIGHDHMESMQESSMKRKERALLRRL